MMVGSFQNSYIFFKNGVTRIWEWRPEKEPRFQHADAMFTSYDWCCCGGLCVSSFDVFLCLHSWSKIERDHEIVLLHLLVLFSFCLVVLTTQGHRLWVGSSLICSGRWIVNHNPSSFTSPDPDEPEVLYTTFRLYLSSSL